jgi:hypothetical protein
MGNICFENVSQFIYLDIKITSQNLIREEINSRLNCGSVPSIQSRNLCVHVRCLQTHELEYTEL